MNKYATNGSSMIGKRWLVLLAALMATAAMYFPWTVQQASAQTSYAFCWKVTLAPYGQYGDRCNSWGGGYLRDSSVYGYYHSACIDYTNGVNQNLMYPWACTPKGTFRYVGFWNDGIYRKPIIRNNTTGDTNMVEGWYECYTDC